MRHFDILISGIAILVLAPFLLPIIIILKFTGEKYIFYRQARVGRDDKVFYVLKFATMLKDSPNLPGGFITQKKDPRILPMGHFLRKTKINELPQLINILIGQMSIVGPRPIVEQHMALYPEETRKAILSMTPGLTGIASVVFRDEEEVLNRAGGDRKYFHDQVIAPYKGELEVWWSKNATLLNYFKIIFLTAWALFFTRSKLWKKWFKDLPKVPETLKEYL